MASKKIQGITIEINGNTTKLQDALKGVDKEVSSLNSQLKDLDKALQLDPTNTDLLAQKQDVLKRNIEATTERLNTLKEAQRQMGDYNGLTDQQKTSYNALSLEIAKSEDALKKMNDQLKGQSKIDLSKVTSALKKIGDVALDVAKKLAKITAAIGGALVAAIGAGVKSYAKLEKAQKGSQRLFEDSFKIVEKNAANAYKSLGISAAEYYDKVNQYAVGLKDALGGDTEAAAKLSDSILTAQADIVAATGADADAVSNAFAAVMRGNYTMIDNLRLGVKGSKEGMQEVIDKVNDWRKANGETTELVMGNYADMQQALVDYVKMQGIAGTASTQMSSTISGSVEQMKAAFENFLSGEGSPEALSETIMNVLGNIAEAIKKLAPSILQGLTDLITDLLPQVAQLLLDLAPQLLDSITNLLNNVLDGLKNNPGKLAEAITTIIDTLVKFVTENLPKLIEIGMLLIKEMATGIMKSIPTILTSMLDLLMAIVDLVIDNLDEFIDLALEIIVTLAEALVDFIPKLVEKVPEIITKLIDAFLKPEMLEKIIKTAVKLIMTLAEGLIKTIPQLLTVVPKIIIQLFKSFAKVITETNWLQLGLDIIKGILEGFVNIGKYIADKVKAVKDKIVGSFKSFFGIKSPSRLMRDEVGTFIGEGVTEGILDGIDDTERQVNDAMKGLASGIEASLNPTINPTLTYETNYEMMARAMREALQDMEVELDDDKVGKFVIKKVEEEVYS